MDNGLLMYKYTLADRRFCYARKRYNPYFAGMTLLGEVLKTEKAFVRVKLDIDEAQDISTAYPWPWTPETGNLMYLMPKLGTRVSIYFGDDNEANGRAIHCVRTNAPPAPPPRTAGSSGASSKPSAPAKAKPYDGSEDGVVSFKPGHRSLSTEHKKMMYLYPDSMGFSSLYGFLNISVNGTEEPGIRASTQGEISIIAMGKINIEGKTVVLKSLKLTDLVMGASAVDIPTPSASPLANMVVKSALAASKPAKMDAKALVHLMDDGIGFIKTKTEEMTIYSATSHQLWERIADDPDKVKIDHGKIWANAAIGTGVVLAIGFATGGIGFLASGGSICVTLALGGGVVLTGTMYVGNQIISDYAKGSASSLGEYLNAAILGSAVGIINGVTGLIPGVGTSVLASAAGGFFTGFTGSILSDLFTGQDINWADAFKSGALSSLSDAIMCGISRYICFVAGTPVLTENGLVPIETIKAGDMVYSENRETGEKGLKRVTRTFVNRTSQLVHGGETVSCTPSHPFYVVDRGWINADQLGEGDELILQSGEVGVVESVEFEALEDSVEIHNFEVEDWHAYYVGSFAVLVHNTCENGLGPYKEQGGHHPMAKKAFKGVPGYDPKTALSISDAKLDAFGVRHPTITVQQNSLYTLYAKTGKPLTMDAMRQIEIQAMVNSQVPLDFATDAVDKAIAELVRSGVTQPIRIPWN